MKLKLLTAACAMALMTAPVYAGGDKHLEQDAMEDHAMHDQTTAYDHEEMAEERAEEAEELAEERADEAEDMAEERQELAEERAEEAEERAEERQELAEERREDAEDMAEDMAEELADAQEQLAEATEVLNEMKADPELADLMADAKGVFVIPDYAAAALVVGGSGGEGVLLSSNAGSLTNPVFYDVGSVSFGAQAGIEVGEIAMILTSDKALESFHQENNFSLDAKAGLSIVDWSARAEGSLGKGDVVVWSDTEGLFGQAAIAISDINYDDEENWAYYNTETTAQAILNGEVPNPHAADLEDALAKN